MPDTADVVRLEDYAPTAYQILDVHLDFRLSPQLTRIIARLKMAPRAGTSGGTALTLVGDDLRLQGIRIDGNSLSEDAYRASADELEINSPPAGEFELEITTVINPAANTQLMGLYRSSDTYCTQCEAEGFRRITYFYDRPDVLARYTTRIEADRAEAPILLSNGNCIEAGEIGDGERHYAVWEDPFPKPSYLFALVAGDLACVTDTFTTTSGRQVDLRIYVEHGNEGRCAYAMDSLKRSMAWDETAYGREYDLDIFMIVAVSDFNMGAMENKGLNVFNDKYVLADPDIATDQDYANIEAIIAHEYFHNWTGNRITCRDWFQLCLKEGLTVFRDQEFSSDERSRAVKRIADVRLLKAHQFPEDAGPLAHPVRPESYKEINNFYTATVYEKGAEVVRMLHTVLGADGFRKGMDLYFNRHDGEAATVEDFVTAFADATGAGLSQFMIWYRQSGTPNLVTNGAYDGTSKTYRLTIEQSCPPTPGQERKVPLHIPVRFGLVGGNGEDISFDSVSGADVTGDVIQLKNARHELVFTGVAARPVPSLLRGFSAPVTLTTNMNDRDLLLLLRADADPLNRWQSAQELATKALIKATSTVQMGKKPNFDRALAAAIGAVAIDDSLDPAFRALLLQMPGEGDIARDINANVDPDAIHTARAEFMRVLAHANAPAFDTLRNGLAIDGAYSPDAASAGKRALRNVLLDYALYAGTGEDLATAQYQSATNMTDRMAALGLLVVHGCSSAPGILADFHDRYEGNALVIDKWLAVQATAPNDQTLDSVKALRDHPAFSMGNPNRVRALIGAFAMANPTQFQRADGAGYNFVSDMILEIDPANAQLAARLASAFRTWRKMEPVRQEHAKAALEKIAAAANLSRDTRDIVERSLADVG